MTHRDENLALLEDLCEVMTEGSLCAMGGLTPMPVRSALTHFADDFVAANRTRKRRPRTSARGRRAPMSLLKEPDYGTPAKDGPATVSRRGRRIRVRVPEGTSVMRAAALAGIDIPKLCATDRLEAFGSCRLCLVEIDGRRGTPASCTTPVADGMSRSHPDAEGREAPRGRHGALHLRPPAGLSDLPGQR